VSQPVLLFLVTEDWYFVSHRLELARAAVAAGYRVVVATRVSRQGAAIRDAGCELRPLGWRRAGNSPWSHLAALRELVHLYRDLRPDLVHHVALKPVIFGAWAAWRAGVAWRVDALAGLGFVFSSTTPRARLLRPLVRLLLRRALAGDGERTIVQNRGDWEVLVEGGIVPPQRVRLIRGAGVALSDYPPGPQRADPPMVVLVARLLWEKGIGEFVAAADELRAAGVLARFVLVGDPDPDNPSSIPDDQIQRWRDSGVVECWGHRPDVPGILAAASIFCLPTRYGEGIPRSLLEAGAAGLALVATDSPGCREVIQDGVNGLLVPPGDGPALVAALRRLLDAPAERSRFGAAARETIAREFTLDRVISETLAVYRELRA
jgi:glycosyltransferase involved in cell wall biosynthesis